MSRMLATAGSPVTSGDQSAMCSRSTQIPLTSHTEDSMRTPSRAALALAMGVFTAGGLTVAATPADASASHGQSARTVHQVSVTVPGTGVRMTSDVDDDGNIVGTSAGDDDGDEVGVDDNGVQLGDDNDAAEALDDQGDGNAQDAADDQGEDDQGADQGGDDQGEDQGGDDHGEDQGDDDQGEV